MTIKELKHELRLRDYFGDRWGVAMGAFFDICAIAYEQISHYDWVENNAQWEYSVGLGGNEIEDDNIFMDLELIDAQIIEIGNYLNKLTNLLRNTEHAY